MGVVDGVQKHAGGVRLCVAAPNLDPAKKGDSICVNGVCLTVASLENPGLGFDVISETLVKTNLGGLKPADRVNIEPSLKIGDRIDGHFVQGHVDGTAAIEKLSRTAREHVIWLRPQAHLLPCIIPKGSVSVDGVSLTVADISDATFSVALIPTTIERTTLGSLRVGDVVNIETDILVRTIIQALHRILPGAQPGDLNEALLALKSGERTPFDPQLLGIGGAR